MNIMLIISIIINVLVLIATIFCLWYFQQKNTNPKVKENSGFTFGILTIIHLITLILLIILGVIKHQFEMLVLILFVIAPFIIGHYSKYEQRVKYTLIQMLCCILSLLCLVIFYLK